MTQLEIHERACWMCGRGCLYGHRSHDGHLGILLPLLPFTHSIPSLLEARAPSCLPMSNAGLRRTLDHRLFKQLQRGSRILVRDEAPFPSPFPLLLPFLRVPSCLIIP